MRYTGWCLIVLGFVTLAFLGLNSLPGGYSDRPPSDAPGVSILLGTVAVSAAGCGTVLLIIGGRGYIRTDNPSVHN